MCEKENQNNLPSPQEFFEWKANQICNEQDPTRLKRFKDITYEEYCIIYKKK